MENDEIATVFDEIADLLDLQGGNVFRIRSYRNAARTVRNLSQRAEDLVKQDADLTDLPNIGDSTADKIKEIVETGTCKRLEEQRAKMPRQVASLMKVPGLGPRTAMQLYKELNVKSLDDLKQACEEEKVRDLDGLGEKTEENILKGIETVRAASSRTLYHTARDHVASLARYLDDADAVSRYEVAGSFRRCKETVGDLDILIRADDRSKATEQILAYDAIDEVVSKGEERVTVRLTNGLQVDFRYFKANAFGAALLYFTGSKAHNIRLRKRAVDRDWKLNEYGLFKDSNRLAGKTEKSVYARLNLPWIPPELREDRGEIDAADEDKLPNLITPDKIRGDLHCHTKITDGMNSLEEMVEAARERKYQYVAITDHSKAVTVAKGLDDKALRERADEIRSVDDDQDDLWVLAGVEVDILESGKLDIDEDTLAELDWVVASVHSHMDMPEDEMTERLCTAISSGVVHCLGHPCCRLIGKRDSIHFDVAKVFDACLEHDVCLEIDAQPDRLDLPDIYCQEAAQAGLHFVISTDAHKTDDMDFMALGVNAARRGWLEKKHVWNTLTAKQLKKRAKRK